VGKLPPVPSGYLKEQHLNRSDIVTNVDAAPLTEAEAETYVRGICFKTGPPGRVGVELEWLVRDRDDPAAEVTPDRLAAALATLRNSGLGTADGDVYRGEALRTVLNNASITVEPGGQLELSSAPAGNLGELVDATCDDLAQLRAAAGVWGLELCGFGLDPHRLPDRVLDLPRYQAMERFFDRTGPWGRQMMRATASVQVCVDAGEEDGYRERWRRLHAIGPVLVAAFANSALRGGKPTGWCSSRQQVWSRMDPSRTRPPEPDADPRDAWTRYALDAQVMCIRTEGPQDWTAPPGLTFRDWIRSGQPRPPGIADLDYHLTTLFPPVRPHGHLELRMIDAQPGDGWIVTAAVVTALAEDPVAARAAEQAVEPVQDRWAAAARLGPADPAIARASRACFDAALEALPRLGVPVFIQNAVDDFAQRYVQRNRCPADDQLEAINQS
jgi:ergothioneine biosynthesis glutamate--cysteine ligase EgtA